MNLDEIFAGLWEWRDKSFHSSPKSLDQIQEHLNALQRVTVDAFMAVSSSDSSDRREQLNILRENLNPLAADTSTWLKSKYSKAAVMAATIPVCAALVRLGQHLLEFVYAEDAIKNIPRGRVLINLINDFEEQNCKWNLRQLKDKYVNKYLDDKSESAIYRTLDALQKAGFVHIVGKTNNWTCRLTSKAKTLIKKDSSPSFARPKPPLLGQDALSSANPFIMQLAERHGTDTNYKFNIDICTEGPKTTIKSAQCTKQEMFINQTFVVNNLTRCNKISPSTSNEHGSSNISAAMNILHKNIAKISNHYQAGTTD
jgi:hypothetical protein